MNAPTVPQGAIPATLKDVVDRLIANSDLSETRRRDLTFCRRHLRQAQGRAALGHPARPRRDPLRARRHRAGAGKSFAQAMGEPA
jgi:hypothetical protein